MKNMQSLSTLEKGSIIAIVGFVCLIVSFAPLYNYLPANLYGESRPSINNGESIYQVIGFLDIGSHVILNISVYGGDGKITAQVVNLGLNPITGAVVINGSGAISFHVASTSYYSLHLTNTLKSQSNDKQLLIKVYYYYYNDIFFIVGILLVVVGVVVIIFHVIRSKKKAPKETSPISPDVDY